MVSNKPSYRSVVPVALVMMCGPGMPCPSQAQFDFDGLVETISTIAEEYEFDPSVLAEPVPAEWDAFWDLVMNALQSQSLEDMAWLHPYAQTALGYLDNMPEARPYADWLRQRLDYFWMAEDLLDQRPPEVRPAPPKPTGITPPPRLPAPPPPPLPATSMAKTMDRERWVHHLEKRSPPAGAATYVPMLKPVFLREGVPAAFVWLAEVESSFDPEARSPVGARGLYQFMPATAERFGLALTPRDERVDPERSATAAARYLRLLHERFGSWPLALAAYNAGEGRVGKLLKTHKATSFEAIAPHLPAETRMYVPKVAAVVKLREGADLSTL